MKTENKFYVILFTFTITFVFVVILSYINSLTYDKVLENREYFKVRAILNAMRIDFSDKMDAIEKFKKYVKKINIGGKDFYVSNVGEKVYAYVFSGNGLWGTITGVVALNKNLDRIVGVDIISQNETPGLGGRIEEDWFKEQFRGEKVDKEIGIKKSEKLGDSNKENYSVDAITGATLTSKFFIKIINNTISEMRKVLRGDTYE
ncbi:MULTISPECIES: FMN-binding protein [unclassified Thermosipho (in: thermotogales)]|uniref:FMN-binding protein n=1 Tax=unclassified Thermosipho (in: thermotogales) TaxID=2676525 RepID=UPI0009493062|nr:MULTISPECIES: FMN-binding protein [unclassified Thermosipho (in: thermotogales)]ANQ53607.1 FMN-binding protein [Thermosipho sp. 1070]OOC44165.1 FMN-binding protein [Thermosipho sp. 1074]